MRRDVVLKGMDELVSQDMVCFCERGCQREDDSAFYPFRHTARSLADGSADDVRLLEVGMRGIEHQRLSALDVVVEHLRETRVPTLGQPADACSRPTFFVVEVDVKVFSLQQFEFELFVLNFVAAEVLGLGVRSDRKDKQ